jgi:hypothetical protein
VDTLDLEPLFDVYEQGDGRGQPPPLCQCG